MKEILSKTVNVFILACGYLAAFSGNSNAMNLMAGYAVLMFTLALASFVISLIVMTSSDIKELNIKVILDFALNIIWVGVWVKMIWQGRVVAGSLGVISCALYAILMLTSYNWRKASE